MGKDIGFDTACHLVDVNGAYDEIDTGRED